MKQLPHLHSLDHRESNPKLYTLVRRRVLITTITNTKIETIPGMECKI
jgi:hypothetical protein